MPMNINYPFQFDSRGRTATTPTIDHVRDMVEQFLFTSPGERVNRPDFGAGLLRRTFEGSSPELATAVQYTVQAGLQHRLQDVVEIELLEVSSDDSTIQVVLHYIVRQTGERRQTTLERPLP